MPGLGQAATRGPYLEEDDRSQTPSFWATKDVASKMICSTTASSRGPF